MLLFYLGLAGAIAVPPSDNHSDGCFHKGAPGHCYLGIGPTHGIFAICSDFYNWPVPAWFVNTWWTTYLWNLLLLASSMVAVSKVIDRYRGKVPRVELLGLVYSQRGQQADLRIWREGTAINNPG